MPPLLADLPPGARIAAIRLRSLGDILLTTPALAAVKSWRPDLRLAYVVEPVWEAAVAGNPDLETIIPAAPTLVGRVAALAALRRFRPHLTVNLHGGSTASWLTALSGAHWRADFAGHRHGWAHNLLAPPEPPPPGRARWHTVEHVASLWRYLGLPPGELGSLRLRPDPGARAEMRRRLAAGGLRGRFVYINAVPRSPAMQWPAERYAQLAAWLAREYGLGAVCARAARFGSAEERIVSPLPAGLGILLAATTVAELIALEAEASLVIGSDGGPLHVAAALGKPTVALFGPTDSVVWHPWRTASRVLTSPGGLEGITLAQVQAAAAELIGGASTSDAAI